MDSSRVRRSPSMETLVILLDVSPSMHPYLKHATGAVRLLVQRKLLFSPRDEVGLVLFGADETDNPLHQQFGGYHNVVVGRELQIVDVEFVRQLQHIPMGSAPGDFLDAIVVGIDLLVTKLGPSAKGNKRLYMITDAEAKLRDPEEGTLEEQVEQVSMAIMEKGIKLDVMGMRLGKEMASSIRSETSLQNELLLRRLLKAAGGEIQTVESAASLMGSMKVKVIRPVTIYRGDLEVSASMKIKVWVYKKTVQQKFPTLKPYSDHAPPTDMTASHTVTHSKEYVNIANPDVIVPPQELRKAYRYGPQIIPVDKEDEETLVLHSEKGVKVIGFTDAGSVPRHQYMKDTNVFVPDPNNEKSAVALSALARALHAMGKIAIVRCVWRASRSPIVVGVLTPHLGEEENDPDTLLFNVLPFAEDIREYTFPSFASFPQEILPTEAEIAAAEKLISSMNLAARGREEVLRPETTINPLLQRFYCFVENKALLGDAEVPPVEDYMRAVLEPDPTLLEEAKEATDLMSSQFAALPAPQMQKASRRFWKDGIAASGEDERLAMTGADNGSGTGVSGVTSVDDEIVGQISLEKLVLKKVESVGSVDPIGDFTKMMERTDSDEWVDKAITGMQKVITGLLDSAYNGNTYEKALECLRVMREKCVIQEEPLKFNEFVRHLREKCYGKQHDGFWQLIIDARLKLINQDEAPDSDVSAEAAAAFFAHSGTRDAGAVQPVEDDEMAALLM